MPTATYTPLATLTLSSGDSSITFANIPNTYRDLIVVCQFQMSGTSSASRLRLNGDSGANYTGVWVQGSGSGSGTSGRESGETGARIVGAAFGPTNTFANSLILQVTDYSATNKHKTVLSRYGAADGEVQATASRWASTTAVNSVTIYDVLGQTYQSGSTFSMWGIIS